ncbi:MAG TPA: PIG-L family deacetylase [Roseiflexaceae bacterium]|nr:PIG-L family deacetylase [Roseiflexaceae bacterium]
MQLEDLGQIHDGYEQIYLSPHLDDAALSCGGAIARHASAGARVLVVTLCTSAPPPDASLSRFAQDHHLMWGLAAERAMAERQREDDLALDRLGADTYRAGLLDAIYRVPEAYIDNNRLFGTPVADDPLSSEARQLAAALQRRAPRATFYAPLGVGNHVDHQIVYAAAREMARAAVAFYEDFPYVLRPEALERRLRALGQRFVANTLDIDATLTRKIGAISAYASQLGSLFEDPAAMAQIISQYAEGLHPQTGTYGERVWLPDAR